MKCLIFFSIIVLTSCSLIINHDKSKIEEAIKERPNNSIYCPVPPTKTKLLGPSENFAQNYLKLIHTLRRKKIKLKFIDKYVLYALMQMNARPDQASPTARHQIYLSHRGKEYYFDFFAKKSPSYPFLYGLDNLLKYFASNHSLIKLGGFIDKYQKNLFFINNNFYDFLSQNKKRLKTSNLAKYYLRAGQILQTGESIPKINFKSLIFKYRKNKKNVSQFNTLIKYVNSKKADISCNLDLNLYQRPLYLSKGLKGDSANFALFDKGSFALGVSSQSLKTLKKLWKTNLFQGTGTQYSAKFCEIKRNGNKMIFISSKGKDPGQHLFHFLKRNMQYIDSFENMADLLASARHLHLVDPLRIIYESRRGNQQELHSLREERYPIYHASNLGHIWAWAKFKGDSALFKDPRANSFLSCPKQRSNKTSF